MAEAERTVSTLRIEGKGVLCQSQPVIESSNRIGWKSLVYLAYLDDSDTRAKQKKWQVLTAVMVRDQLFGSLELLTARVVLELLSDEQLERFEEFHAAELYGGYGVFEGIDQAKRFAAIEKLLASVTMVGAVIAYGAVDLGLHRKSDYSSANPLDVAFRSCVKGMERWLSDQTNASLNRDPVSYEIHEALLIADDGDKKDKNDLQKSFRELRAKMSMPSDNGTVFNFHDDMYFGDSRYSIGIQMADICGYFITKHLEDDAKAEGFYNLIKDNIVYPVS